MITDYEDDTHFCLKCHATIIGLENYVNHRKTGCPKTINVVDIPKSPLPSQLLPPDESFTLKADDFFSSLELQSSSKKAPVPSTSGKTFSGILTRSKTSAAIQASNPTRENVAEQSKSGKNAWIGGHQLKELGTGDNQTKLIKAVDNLSRNVGIKKDDPPDLRVYESDEESDEFDYEDDEFDEDDDAPPRSFTGGKWKPSSPISEWSEMPPNYTGGKWKPKRMFLSPPQNHTKGKWKPQSPVPKSFDVPLPTFTGSKWTPTKARNEYGDVPPLNHTKGKWKPLTVKEKSARWEQDDEFPPPSHTKGKWKPQKSDESKDKSKAADDSEKKKISDESPPFRKSNGSVQYWCGPCNRRLASKIVYERHLKSELHFKRTLHEAEFDDSSHLNTNPDKETKRTIRKPVEYWSHTANEDNKDTMKNTTAPKRIRRKVYVKCEVCRARVTSQMMGKHLISHYHCRKGDISLPEAQKMVLDNIHNIVLQSPYQCSSCKFYCNTQEYFLQHWNTAEHIVNIEKYPGLIWCAFCKFSCTDNITMYIHLNSPEHEEVISVINRSVPIIIKRINPIKCETCNKNFLFNIQLRKHCEKESHQYSGTSSDEYQKKQKCHLCSRILKSALVLQRHLIRAHNVKVYFCSVCALVFKSAEEIQRHRNGNEHRYAILDSNKIDLLKKCDYCEEIFKNNSNLKKHLKIKHPERTHDCPHCGKKFTIPQDVSVHIRYKLCTFLRVQKSNVCDRCPYSSDTLSDLLFHKALHEEALIIPAKASATRQQPQHNYKCPLCEKYFAKASLRYHIQNHTNEKAYVCNYCNARFARKNNWKLHLKNHENKGSDGENKPKGMKQKMDNSYLCATCGANFSRNSTLQKHMLIHDGKKYRCSQEGCFHLARTASELKSHIKTHSDEKNYQCSHCDYSGKTSQQLKRHKTIHEEVKKYSCSRCSFTTRLSFHLRRHERVHSGSKPYACPHCDYRSNNLENLRKHVLSTNKHPGKCIYECKFCEEDQFQTNFAKDFKVHLITEHGDVFESGTEAAGYIAGIYDSLEDGNALHKESEIAGNKIGTTGMLNLGIEEPAASTAAAVAATAATSQIVANGLIAQQEVPSSYSNKGDEELFPMYIIAKDEVVCVDKDTWSIVASFEGSGTLVTPLFQEHFE